MAEQDASIRETQSSPIPPLEEIFFLTITVESARDLKAADLNGSSDPFCTVIATTPDTKQSWTTKTIEKDLNPQWNEETSFVFFDKCEKIEFEVWDKDTNTKDDSIGKVCLKADSFDYQEKAFDGELKLENVKKGYIKVKVAGRSIKPLELEKRCESLQNELESQEQILQNKEQERQQAANLHAKNESTKKELEENVNSLQRELDSVNEQIDAQKKRNEDKRKEIERLKESKADLEGKLKSKREQKVSLEEKLEAEQRKLKETKEELEELEELNNKDQE